MKFKDKTFQLFECDDDDQVIGEVLDEHVFLAGDKQGGGNSGNKRACPLKCGKLNTNSSLFFCNQFRKKDQEERKAIQTKLQNLCILCLERKGAQHQCPVKSCVRCGAGHNVLLCNKEDPDRAFITSEIASDGELTEDPEALTNMDKCFMVKRNKPQEPKGAQSIQLEEVKALLKELSAEQRGSKKENEGR